MSLILKVPTHLDGRNALVGRYTARELVPVVAGVFGAAGVLGQPHLLFPARLGEALTVIVLGGALGLVRPGGRSLVAWGHRTVTHLLDARTAVWVPPVLPASTAAHDAPLRPPHLVRAMGAGTLAPAAAPSAPSHESGGTPHPARRPATPAYPFVPTEIDADTITFTDGRRCAALECSGTTVDGLDAEGHHALHGAYHAFLLGLAFPVQMLVCADLVDLGPYAARRAARLAGHPLAVRRLGSADAAYMRRALAQAGALDQRVYVVIPDATRPAPSLDRASLRALLRSRWQRGDGRRARGEVAGQDADAASRLLDERCVAVREGLAQAGVHAWRLDTSALQRLYYLRLCPRTARLQPFDPGHAARVAASCVVFGPAALADDDQVEEDDDADADVA